MPDYQYSAGVKKRDAGYYIITALGGLVDKLRQNNILAQQQKLLAEKAGYQREQNFFDVLRSPEFMRLQSPGGLEDINRYLESKGLPGGLQMPQKEEPPAAQDMVEPTARMRKYGYNKPLPLKEFIQAQNNILDFEKPTAATTKKEEPQKSNEQQLLEDELSLTERQLLRYSTPSQYDYSNEIKKLSDRKKLLQKALLKVKNGEKLSEEEWQQIYGEEQQNGGLNKADVMRHVAEMMPGYKQFLENKGKPKQKTQLADPLGIR